MDKKLTTDEKLNPKNIDKLCSFIQDNYDVEEFIEILLEYCHMNTDTSSEEEDDEKIDINIDKDGFYSIK
tara:strand:- start:151 stop:360 length:210 start_codon:yes stop_codon:yes gene_type:complete